MSEASTKGSATINAQNNTFDMTTINAHSLVGGMSNNEAKTLAKADISAVDISVAVGADNDQASTTLETTSNTNFSYNTIKGITQNGSIIGYEEVKQLTERLDENGNIEKTEVAKRYTEKFKGNTSFVSQSRILFYFSSISNKSSIRSTNASAMV